MALLETPYNVFFEEYQTISSFPSLPLFYGHLAAFTSHSIRRSIPFDSYSLPEAASPQSRDKHAPSAKPNVKPLQFPQVAVPPLAA